MRELHTEAINEITKQRTEAERTRREALEEIERRDSLITSETHDLASKIEGEAQMKIKAAEDKCIMLRAEAEELVRANQKVTQQKALKYANKLEQQLKEQEEAMAFREKARADEMQRIFSLDFLESSSLSPLWLRLTLDVSSSPLVATKAFIILRFMASSTLPDDVIFKLESSQPLLQDHPVCPAMTSAIRLITCYSGWNVQISLSIVDSGYGIQIQYWYGKVLVSNEVN